MCSCTYESYESGTCPCLGKNNIYNINTEPVLCITFLVSIALPVCLIVLGVIVGKSTPKSNLTSTDPYDDELDGI